MVMICNACRTSDFLPPLKLYLFSQAVIFYNIRLIRLFLFFLRRKMIAKLKFLLSYLLCLRIYEKGEGLGGIVFNLARYVD